MTARVQYVRHQRYPNKHITQRVAVCRTASAVISAAAPVCGIIRLHTQLSKYRKQRRVMRDLVPHILRLAAPFAPPAISVPQAENLLRMCDVTLLCLCSHKLRRSYK